MEYLQKLLGLHHVFEIVIIHFPYPWLRVGKNKTPEEVATPLGQNGTLLSRRSSRHLSDGKNPVSSDPVSADAAKRESCIVSRRNWRN